MKRLVAYVLADYEPVAESVDVPAIDVRCPRFVLCCNPADTVRGTATAQPKGEPEVSLPIRLCRAGWDKRPGHLTVELAPWCWLTVDCGLQQPRLAWNGHTDHEARDPGVRTDLVVNQERLADPCIRAGTTHAVVEQPFDPDLASAFTGGKSGEKAGQDDQPRKNFELAEHVSPLGLDVKLEKGTQGLGVPES